MDKDIQEMFQQKNREILIHNLELDVERNIEVLNETLANIFNHQFDIAIKNISLMYQEKEQIKELTRKLITLKSQTFLALQKVIQKKKDALLLEVSQLEFEENQMREYYDFVFTTTEEMQSFFQREEMEHLLEETIAAFDLMNQSCFQGDELEMVNSRIHDYIRYRLFGKLIERLKEEFLIRDNNLTNKGKESYEKFQELESKTCFSD